MKKKRYIIGAILFLLWQPGHPIHAATAEHNPLQAEHALYNHLENLTGPADPQSPQKPFLALKKALDRLNTIRLLGGWPAIPEGRRIKPGCKDSRVPLLRQRLVISGDAGLETLGLDEVYDAPLVAGVRRFQHRHGLKADGVVGPATLAELNTSVQERITQIKLNMLRWRRMPEQMGQRYLLANIPGFRLDVVENNQVVRSMRTIVGKPERPTPVMSAMMTYLEISPYWNIPQQIARTDILPKIDADALFLRHNGIEVFDSWREDAPALDPSTIDWKRFSEAYFPFRLRQKPSASNALGRIKFIFPNRFSVYIHDTPARSLFSKNSRSYSSGCVRIEKPLTLADYLLADQGWDKDKIVDKVKRNERTVVVLKKAIRVHLVYMTAWADSNDTVYFYHDLYGRDRRLLEELNRPRCRAACPGFRTDANRPDRRKEERPRRGRTIRGR
jgi:murein L,D-transpeptidase YcbB/YkuD